MGPYLWNHVSPYVILQTEGELVIFICFWELNSIDFYCKKMGTYYPCNWLSSYLNAQLNFSVLNCWNMLLYNSPSMMFESMLKHFALCNRLTRQGMNASGILAFKPDPIMLFNKFTLTGGKTFHIRLKRGEPFYIKLPNNQARLKNSGWIWFPP